MIRLAIIAALALAGCSAPDAAGVIGHTLHANAENPDKFDEGLRVRGVVAEWQGETINTSLAAYDHSFIGSAMGVTASVTYNPATIAAGPLAVTPIAGISWYPDEPSKRLEETNGFFPLIGISATADVGAATFFTNVYPSLIREGDYSFDALIVSGLMWRF